MSNSPPKLEVINEGDALSNLHQRIITSALLIAASAVIVMLGGWAFLLAMLVIAYVMDQEWRTLTPSTLSWKAIGIAYITLPIIAAITLRDLSLIALLFPVLLVISTDIGAYIVGKSCGGPKLAPSISPGKTWSGLIGGITTSAVVAILLHQYVPWPSYSYSAILLGVMMAVLAQMGDLFESWLKRQKGVKDSGTVLPGHGGVLDRMDGYILTLPFYLLCLILWAEMSA